MQPTEISWADYTWNPVTGCSRYGPECTNCWAERFMRRQAARDGAPAYMTDDPWTRENAAKVVTMHDDRLEEPLEYTYPSGPGRIFAVSMGDLFHRRVSERFIQDVVDVARQLPEQEFVFLTKRPQRAAELALEWPANTIVGTSTGSGPGGQYSDTTHRIDQLRGVDARRWISFEPLIEPVGSVDLTGIDWVVVGGESAPAADRREMDHRWAVDIFERCRDAGVPFFFKQSSGSTNETGARLTIQDHDRGTYDRREIRQVPAPPDATQQARKEVLEA